jgi:outer membrane receptor protein involved in Fe transport
MRRLIAIFILTLLPAISLCQTMTVKGNIVDSLGGPGVANAVVMAVRLQDSILVKFTRTDADGKFILDSLSVDTFQIIISSPLHGDQTIIILGDSTKAVNDLKGIILPPKNITLQTVNIFGYTDPIYYRGDTLVYTADSFKVKANAVVEDLLKKLPGIRVDQNGKIFSEGKAVDQVLVDGDEFFGSDPTIATKNLQARSVESVNVYEKKNENATANGEEENLKIMDLRLKENAKKGYFGKLSASTGLNNYYDGQALFNKFKGRQKISVFALGTNTPNSSLGWEDINKYGFSNEGNSWTGDDGMMYSMNSNNQNGIPKTFRSGVYYSDQLSKKTQLSLNYTYGSLHLAEQSEISSQYFLGDTTYNSFSHKSSVKNNNNHNASAKIIHNYDSLTTIEIRSRIKYNLSDAINNRSNIYTTTEGIQSRINSVLNTSSGDNKEIGASIKYSRNFLKKDRRFTASYNFADYQNSSSGLLQSSDIYLYDPSIPSDSIDQKKENHSDRQTHSAAVSFTEPLNLKVKTEFTAEADYIPGTLSRTALDFFNGNYTSENAALTNRFTTHRFISRIGGKLIYEVKKQNLQVGLRLRYLEAANKNLENGEELKQKASTVLPSLTYRYKFTDNQSINFKYTTSSREPDLNQLQPVPDNTNPNYIVLGNPSLLPSYSHNFGAGFSSFKPISGKTIFTNANMSLIYNSIVNASSYDSVGRVISMPVNVDGNYTGSFYITASFPFYSKVLLIRPSANVQLSHSVNYVNSDKNITDESSPYGEIEIGINTEKIEFNVTGGLSYFTSSNSLSSKSNSEYHTIEIGSRLEAELPFKFSFNSSVIYKKNYNRGIDYNIDYIVYNASLSKKFLKKENLIFSVEGIDLLNQNVDTYRQIQDNVISDIKEDVVGRYILFRVTYKFTNEYKEEESK